MCKCSIQTPLEIVLILDRNSSFLLLYYIFLTLPNKNGTLRPIINHNIRSFCLVIDRRLSLPKTEGSAEGGDNQTFGLNRRYSSVEA